MSQAPANIDRLMLLASAVCDEVASKAELAELDAILLANETDRLRYLDCCTIHIALGLELQAGREVQKAFEKTDLASTTWTSADHAAQTATSPTSFPAFSPISGFFSTTIHGTIGYFSHEIPFSFLIGAVLTSLFVLIAWLIPVSKPIQIVTELSSLQSSLDPKTEIIGKITGMADCKWADSRAKIFNGTNVRLGCKYALVSGLMEITYDTGTAVILQGPVTYEVESRNGGFLPIGRLTGKVKNKAAKGFVVRTPTAVVTDLGTEFGVDVDKSGQSDVCVHSGEVTIRGAGTACTSPSIVLKAGEAKRIPSSDFKSWITLDAKYTSIAHPLTIHSTKGNTIATDELLFSDDFHSFSLGTRWQAVKNAPPNMMLRAVIDGDRTVLSMQSKANEMLRKAIETIDPIPLNGLKHLTVETLFQPRQGLHPMLELHVKGGSVETRMIVQPRTADGVRRIGADVTSGGQWYTSLSKPEAYWDHRYYRLVLSLDSKGVTASFKDSVNLKPLWEARFDKFKLADFGNAVKISLDQITYSEDFPSECNVDWLTVRGKRTDDSSAASSDVRAGQD